jgi:DNA-binding transcriptional LysR family regulator
MAVQLGSISRAAQSLHLSQPGLSKRLRSLEAVAGTELLARSTRGVTMTPAGSRLYGAARRLLVEAEAVEALMCESAYPEQPVRVTASPTIAELWLPGVLAGFAIAGEGGPCVEVRTASSTVVRRMVDDGEADLGLAAIDARRPAHGESEAIVWDSELMVAVPPAHPWSTVDEIDPAEFAQTRMIRSESGADSGRVVEAALESVGLVQVAALAEVGGTTAAIAMMRATGAPAIVPALGTPDGSELLFRRVRGLRFEQQFALLRPRSLHNLPRSARALAQHLLASRPAAVA